MWLTQQQIAELYDTNQQNISQHIDSIYKDRELDREATNKKFLLVRIEGTRQVKRNIDHIKLILICKRDFFETERVHFDVSGDNIVIYENISDSPYAGAEPYQNIPPL